MFSLFLLLVYFSSSFSHFLSLRFNQLEESLFFPYHIVPFSLPLILLLFNYVSPRLHFSRFPKHFLFMSYSSSCIHTDFFSDLFSFAPLVITRISLPYACCRVSFFPDEKKFAKRFDSLSTSRPSQRASRESRNLYTITSGARSRDCPWENYLFASLTF